MHTNSDALPTYPEFLKNRFKDTKTFLKTIQKGYLKVLIYFDTTNIYLVTVDNFNRQVDFEERKRTLFID
ncbi:MAG: hypothetical protein ACI9JN_000991 [Bacteroidia bacterium]|jgi:hypothetical protein